MPGREPVGINGNGDENRILVSTQEENIASQKVLMESPGVEEVYMDRINGKSTGQLELKKMLDYMRKVMESISHFVRNARDLLES